MNWTKPDFRELNLSAEIGMYFEDADFMPGESPAREAANGVEPKTTKRLRELKSS